MTALLVSSGCSRIDPLEPAEGDGQYDPDKSLLSGTVFRATPINTVPEIASMLSRARVIKQENFHVVAGDSDSDLGIYTFQVLDQNAEVPAVGAILLGRQVGSPCEVTRVTRQDDILQVETIPVDWSLVSDAGLLGFDVPLEAGAGEKDGVTWGPWRLQDDGSGPPEGLQTSSGIPVSTDNFDPADFFFNNFSLCGGDGDDVELCLDFDIRVLDGHFDLSGDTHFNFDAGDCFDPTSIFCDFNPIDDVSAWATENLDAALQLHIEGGGHIGVEKCFYGYCLPNFAAVRDFDVAGMSGSLKLGLVVGIQLGVTDMEFETGFEMTNHIEAGARWSSSGGFSTIWETSGSFDPNFQIISYGSGFAKIYVGPKLEVRFDALGEDDVFNVEIGVFPYTRGLIDLDDILDSCPNYNTTIDAGIEAVVEANLDFLILEPEFDMVFGLDPYVLAQFWGTGNLKVHTDVTGVDIDPSCRVSAWRTDPEEAPAWNEEFSKVLAANETASWYGESCRVFRPPFLDPIWSDCGLVATDHDVAIDDIMWNCALAGEAQVTKCINNTGNTEHTFEIHCISVFEALCNYLDDSLAAGLIKNPGVANSFCIKFESADANRNRGNIRGAVNVLEAALQHLKAQEDKGLNPVVAHELRLRINQVITEYLKVKRIAWK